MPSAADQRAGDDDSEPGLPDLTELPLADVLSPDDDSPLARAIRRRLSEVTHDEEALTAFDNFAPRDPSW